MVGVEMVVGMEMVIRVEMVVGMDMVVWDEVRDRAGLKLRLILKCSHRLLKHKTVISQKFTNPKSNSAQNLPKLDFKLEAALRYYSHQDITLFVGGVHYYALGS